MSPPAVRLGNILEERDTRHCTDETVLSVYRDHGVVPKASRSDNFNKTPEDVSAYKLVLASDVVVNKMKAWQGSVAVSRHRGIVSGDYLVSEVARTDLVEPGYLHYALRSSLVISEIRRLSTGIRPSQWRIYWDDFRNIEIVLPSVEKQRRIAAFLDAEMKRIDQLVVTKIRMVSNVEERHNAQIEAELREASARHERASLRRLVTSITQGTSSQASNRPAAEGEWGILKLSAVKNGRFLPLENKALDGDSTVDETLRPNVGDLLVTRSNTPAYVGDACAVEEEPGKVLLPDLIYRLVVGDGADARFLSAALRTTSSRHHLSSAARGTSQSMVKLRGEDILDCVVPAPPLDEQRAIAESLDESRRKADELVAVLRDQIALLGERRGSLITAMVTGEMEVL